MNTAEKWVVRNPPHSLPELWLGDETCVSDRIFSSGRASEIARKLNAHDDLLAACKAMRRTMYSSESEESKLADAAIAKAEGAT